MTATDDEKRRWRAAFDAAIGPTPQAPDRMHALTTRYADWRRRRRILLSTGAASFAALAVAAAGIAIAVGPGHSTHPPDTTPVISSTAPPSPSSVSPSPSAPPGSTSASPKPTSTPTPTPPDQSASVGSTTSGLQGVVVDEAGKPLPHIYVTSWKGVTQTGVDGRFVAPASSDGHHGACLLFSSQPLWTSEHGAPSGGDYAWQAWPAPNTSNCAPEVNANLRIVMHPGADVFGTVRDPAGAPVAGVTVYSTIDVFFMSTSAEPPHFATVTDSEGRYRIYGQQQAVGTAMSVRQPPGAPCFGGLAYPAAAGSGAPVDLPDYGEDCDRPFAPSNCPNASPPATATATSEVTPSPAPS